MTLVGAVYAPNAPFLISPPAFGGVGEEAASALRDLRVLERYHPDAIVVSTPHWVSSPDLKVNVSPRPKQVFDFSGFPPALSEVHYEPPGDPELARGLVQAGKDAGLAVEGTTGWGLDHGAWAPLLHLAPGAKTPVVPLSIRPRDRPLHVRWGEAMRKVLDGPGRRLLLVATGSIVHDFNRFNPDPSARWPEGEAIEGEVLDLALAGNTKGLLAFDPRKWGQVQPEGDLAPLFTLLGATGDRFQARLVDRKHAFGGFSLTTLEFTPRGSSTG